MNDEPNYYAIIPADVRYDGELIHGSKLLYGEITALSNQKGYCWASDSYFANLYNTSKKTIQTWLKSLESNGYISREVQYKEGSNEIVSRYIRLCVYPTHEKVHRGMHEKVRDNNTSFNTTINNKKDIKTSCKYSEEHLRLATILRDNLLDDYPNEMKKAKMDKWADVFRLMEEKDGATIEQIEYVIQWLGKGCFWTKNIRSAEKLRTKFEVLKNEIKDEKENKKSRYANKKPRVESVPDWANEQEADKRDNIPVRMTDERKKYLADMLEEISGEEQKK